MKRLSKKVLAFLLAILMVASCMTTAIMNSDGLFKSVKAASTSVEAYAGQIYGLNLANALGVSSSTSVKYGYSTSSSATSPDVDLVSSSLSNLTLSEGVTYYVMKATNTGKWYSPNWVWSMTGDTFTVKIYYNVTVTTDDLSTAVTAGSETLSASTDNVVKVYKGDSVTISAPALADYYANIDGENTGVGKANSKTLSNVTADQTVTVDYVADTDSTVEAGDTNGATVKVNGETAPQSVAANSTATVTVTPANNTYITKVSLNDAEVTDGTFNNGVYTFTVTAGADKATYTVDVATASPVVSGIPTSITYNPETMTAAEALKAIVDAVKPAGAEVEIYGLVSYVGFDGTTFDYPDILGGQSTAETIFAEKLANNDIKVRVTYNGGGEGSNQPYTQLTDVVVKVVDPRDKITLSWDEIPATVYYSNNYSTETADTTDADLYNVSDVLKYVNVNDADGNELSNFSGTLTVKAYDGDTEVTALSAGKTYKFTVSFDGDADYQSASSISTEIYLNVEPTASTVTTDGNAVYAINGTEMTETSAAVASGETVTITVTPSENNTYISEVYINNVKQNGSYNNGVFTVDSFTAGTRKTYDVKVVTASPVISGIPESIGYNEHMSAGATLKQVLDSVKPAGAVVEFYAPIAGYGTLPIKYDGTTYTYTGTGADLVNGAVDAFGGYESIFTSLLKSADSLKVRVTYNGGGEGSNLPYAQVTDTVSLVENRTKKFTIEWNVPTLVYYSNNTSDEYSPDVYTAEDVLQFVTVKDSDGKDVTSSYKSKLTVTASADTLSAGSFDFTVKFGGDATYLPSTFAARTITLINVPGFSDIVADADGATVTATSDAGTNTVEIGGHEAKFTVTPGDNRYITSVEVVDENNNPVSHTGDFTEKGVYEGKFTSGAYEDGEKEYTIKVTTAPVIAFGTYTTYSYNELMNAVADALPEIKSNITVADGISVDDLSYAYLVGYGIYSPLVLSSPETFGPTGTETSMTEKIRVTYTSNNIRYPDVTTYVDITLVDDRATPVLVLENARKVYEITNGELPASVAYNAVFKSLTAGETVLTGAYDEMTVTCTPVSTDEDGYGTYTVTAVFNATVDYHESNTASATIEVVKPEFTATVQAGTVNGAVVKRGENDLVASGAQTVEAEEEKVTITVTPDDGKYISDVTVDNATDADVTFNGTVATVTFSTVRDTVYTVNVTTGDAVLKASDGEICCNDFVTDEEIIEAILALVDEENSVPVPSEEGTYTVTYYAGIVPIIESEIWETIDYVPYTSLAHAFGDNEVEKVMITYDADGDRYPEASVVINVTITDDRQASVITLKEGQSVTYSDDLTNKDIYDLVFDSLKGKDDGLDIEAVYGNDITFSIDSLNAGTHTVTVTYSGSAEYADSTASVEVTIEKAPCDVVVYSKTVSYAERDTVSGMIYSNPADIQKITFVVGLNAAEGQSYIHVDLPEIIDVDSIENETVKMMIAPVIEQLNSGLNSTLTVDELANYLETAVDALESAEDTLGVDLPINIDTATVDSLVSALRSIGELEGVGDMDVKVTVDGNIVPEDSGAYLVGTITADNNYETDASIGYLVIVPNTVEATLGFNIDDENGIITRGSIINGDYDLGSHVEKDGLTDAQYASATSHLHNVYLGINTDGTFYASNEPSAAIGAYTQIAYLADWGNELIWAKPIVRSYIVVADAVDVKFIDENGNENDDRIFVYDGTPKSMTAKAYDRNGNELDSSNITYYYIGVEGDVEGYYSSEAPVAAGAYTVIAVYVDEDQTHAGIAAGAMVIAPADAEVGVSDKIHVYDGNAVDVTDMITKTPDDAKMTVIVAGIDVNGDFSENGFAAVDGVVNVDFPTRVDNILSAVIPGAYTDGVTADTFVTALEKAKSALEAAGIDSAAIDDIIDMLSAMPDSVTLTFKETSEINPVAIGAYIVAAVITDPDYKAEPGIGTLFIIPEITEAELEWNYDDLNGIITRPVLDSVDLNATAFADGEANDKLTARIEYIIVGIDENGNPVLTNDATNLPNGVYTQIAYIVDEISADMYVAEPIIRSFILVEQTVDVEVTDKTVTYDGNAHEVDIKVTDLAGNEITGDRLDNLTVTYTGVNLVDGLYRSSEAPVNAGSYVVTALYTEYDEDGNLKYVGLDIGTLVIEPAEAELEVIDTTTCYTGDGKFPNLNNPEGLDYIAVIVDEDNNVNIILPTAWGVESGSYDADTAISKIVAELENLKTDINVRETLSDIIDELEAVYESIDLDEITDKLATELEALKDEVANSETVQAVIDELKALKDEAASNETVQAIIDELKALKNEVESGEIIDNAITELEALKSELLANEDVQAAIAELKALKNEIASNETVQAAIAELKELKNEIESGEIIDNAIAELETIKSELLANENVQEIIDELKALKNELINSETADDVAAKLAEIKAELKTLANELGTNEYVTAALGMVAALEEMLSEIESPEEALATLKDVLDKVADKLIATLNEELNNLQDALNVYNQAIDELNALLEGLDINTLTINGALPSEVGEYDVTCIGFDENHKVVVDDGVLTIIHKFKVAFDANGGEGTMDVQVFDYDVEQALTANAFTREGYEFLGWALTADGDVVYTDGQVVSNLTETCGETVTLYAVWKLIEEEEEDVTVNTYSLYFDKNTEDEVTNMPEDILDQDTPDFVIPENVPEREGYKFLGWSTVPEGPEEYQPGDNYTIPVAAAYGRMRATVTVENSDILYAIWEEVTDDNTEVKGEDDVKTGDDFNKTLWINIMLVSAMGIAVSVFFACKKRKKEEEA